ncbi:MAG TPA: HAMP domain-containing sensor histidine kinase [bacterium]|nr:HAMP domain-containing sensor histidine kinase [bacterium]
MKKKENRKRRSSFADALDSITKPFEVAIKPIEAVVNPVIVKPVEFLAEKFNNLMKALERKNSEEKISDVDGFVDNLLDNIKTAEKSFYPFLKEILLIHNLAEGMATLVNEIEILNILGNQIQKTMKVDFIVGFLCNEENKELIPGYKFLPEGFSLPQEFYLFAKEKFNSGEVHLYENVSLEREKFNILVSPLRTTSEKFGIFFVGKKSTTEDFSPEETTPIIAGCAMVSFAISNFKLNQKILREKNLVLLGQAIGTISHDIKNLLTGLEGGIEMINNALQDKDLHAIETATAILTRSYQKIKALVFSMLDYARDRTPDLQICDYNKVVADSIAVIKESFKDRNIKIIEHYDPSIPKVAIDPERIDRMVSNLVVNAIDAVEENKGTINISTRYLPEKNIIELKVSDNGKGIPHNALKKIFDSFYSTKGTRGTGFGLAIVEKVVKEHQGTINVESEINKGSTFTIHIPVRIS